MNKHFKKGKKIFLHQFVKHFFTFEDIFRVGFAFEWFLNHDRQKRYSTVLKNNNFTCISKTAMMPSMAPLARYVPSGDTARDSVNLPLHTNIRIEDCDVR